MQFFDQFLNCLFIRFLLFLFKSLLAHLVLPGLLLEKGQNHVQRRQEVGFRMKWFLFIGHAHLPFLEVAGDRHRLPEYPANPKTAVTFYSEPASGRLAAGPGVRSCRSMVDEREQRFPPRSRHFLTPAGRGAEKCEALVWFQST